MSPLLAQCDGEFVPAQLSQRCCLRKEGLLMVHLLLIFCYRMSNRTSVSIWNSYSLLATHQFCSRRRLLTYSSLLYTSSTDQVIVSERSYSTSDQLPLWRETEKKKSLSFFSLAGSHQCPKSHPQWGLLICLKLTICFGPLFQESVRLI